jgi:hypothetical protein
MASGFIYLIILGMWAAYFVPRWVSDHQENSGKNSEKFNTALRSVTQSEFRKNQSEDKSAKHAQMRNRRIVFSSLLAILIGNTVTVGIGMVAAPVLAIPTSAILIYTVHVRRQVVAAQVKQRRLNALERIAGANVINEPTEQIKISSREDFQDSYKEHWIPLLERTDTAGVVLIPKGEKRDEWQPREVPKPTYVDAPKAVVPKRIIDLTVPGAWIETQKASPLEDLIMPEELFDQVLAEEVARDRAVNE